MTGAYQVAKRINSQIKEIGFSRKLVVAVEGYSGSGKTTIARQLKKINRQVEILHLDDFIKHWKDRVKLMSKARYKSRVFELNWYRYKEVERLIKLFKNSSKGFAITKVYDFDTNDFHKELKKFDLSKKILIVDGIFLYHPSHAISKLFDMKIYISAQKKTADKRRLQRDRKRFGMVVNDNHPDSWFKYYKKAYQGYVKKYKPAKLADFVIKVK